MNLTHAYEAFMAAQDELCQQDSQVCWGWATQEDLDDLGWTDFHMGVLKRDLRSLRSACYDVTLDRLCDRIARGYAEVPLCGTEAASHPHCKSTWDEAGLHLRCTQCGVDGT